MDNLRKRQYKSGYARVLFGLYLVSLFYFLFFSERYGRSTASSEYRYNLVLFQEINRFIQYRNVIGVESFIVNILGNVFAFAPFGFFIPLVSRSKKGFFNVLLLCMEFSLTIELIQLMTKVGIFDVDDIVMNTIGGILGYLAYAIWNKWFRRRTK